MGDYNDDLLELMDDEEIYRDVTDRFGSDTGQHIEHLDHYIKGAIADYEFEEDEDLDWTDPPRSVRLLLEEDNRRVWRTRLPGDLTPEEEQAAQPITVSYIDAQEPGR